MRAGQSRSGRWERALLWGYSAGLGLGLLAMSPWWIGRMAATRRYREGLLERLGYVPARLEAAVHGKRVVWAHAVSVGEVLAVSRLVVELGAALGAALGDGLPGPTLADDEAVGEDGAPGVAGQTRASWVVVVSTTTRTGQLLARERFGADRVFYFPLDFAGPVRAYLRVLRPALLLLAESELWPRMLAECERSGVPVAVVNARVSDRSYRRAVRVRRVWGRVLRKVKLWLAQSEEDARRLTGMGAHEAAVVRAGNLKFDVRAPGENAMTRRVGALLWRSRLIVAGSTLEGEEAMLLRLWPELLRQVPDAVLLLAPRHPERFAQIWEMIRASNFPFLRCSQLSAGAAPAFPGTILLLDTLGDLSSVYRLAEVAFVGGSLVRRGGHNPLEPAQFGVPVVMGPSVENFRAVVASLEGAGGIRIVQDEAGLRSALVELMRNAGAGQAMGESAQRVFEREGGATARCVAALLPLVHAADGGPGKSEAVLA